MPSFSTCSYYRTKQSNNSRRNSTRYKLCKSKRKSKGKKEVQRVTQPKKEMKLNNKCVRLFTDKHLENIGTMFKTLYNDELLTDCTLHCKDGSLRAHKVILAASSPYFRKVFLEHKDERAIFIMHGISLDQLKDLLELIYKGVIDVPSDTLNRVYDLAEELELTGVLLEEGSSETKCNGYGRDTRYKGQKRVAVDFATEDSELRPEKLVRNSTERRASLSSDKGSSCPKKPEVVTYLDDQEKNADTSTESVEPNNDPLKSEGSSKDRFLERSVDERSSLSVWARKERKFKCDLCPSSFKRASHLSRHQLVHTGERPFACNQCDKAFSRHDKLKHHIHKAHELPVLNEALPPDSLYTIQHVRILSPEQTMIESSEPVVHSPPSSPTPAVPPPQKKGRGRPRKYPPVPQPLIKRPRGRPRLNPIVPQESQKQENYDISNMPYGDIEYLTKHIDETIEELSLEDQGLMEPLVEIKTEPCEKPVTEKVEKTGPTFLENIGLFENSAVAKIGECTISVANSSNST